MAGASHPATKGDIRLLGSRIIRSSRSVVTSGRNDVVAHSDEVYGAITLRLRVEMVDKLQGDGFIQVGTLLGTALILPTEKINGASMDASSSSRFIDVADLGWQVWSRAHAGGGGQGVRSTRTSARDSGR